MLYASRPSFGFKRSPKSDFAFCNACTNFALVGQENTHQLASTVVNGKCASVVQQCCYRNVYTLFLAANIRLTLAFFRLIFFSHGSARRAQQLAVHMCPANERIGVDGLQLYQTICSCSAAYDAITRCRSSCISFS